MKRMSVMSRMVTCGFLWSVLLVQIVAAGTIGGSTINSNSWDQVPGLPGGGYALGAGTLGEYAYAVGGDGLGQTNVVRLDGATSVSVAGLPASQTRLAVGVLSDTLYAIGGNAGGSTNVFSFNGTSWSPVKGLPAAREWLAAGTLDGVLYAVGGSNQTNVYAFDGADWAQVSGLPAGREKLASVAYSNKLYAIGGNNSDSVYAFDGATWSAAASLPAGRQSLAAAAFDGYLFAIGGENSGAKTNVYRFNGTSWTETAGLPAARHALAAAVLGDRLYAIGGSDQTNIYRYPAGGVYSGVSPESGSYPGGYPVVISGTDLSDGTLGDISSVTLCGVAATIDSVNGSTQIVVTAGRAGGAAIGTGDVRVSSISQGVSVKTNGFTYGGVAGLRIEGLGGTVVVHSAPASVASGTFFTPPLRAGSSQTNTFSFINDGTNDLTISSFLVGGTGAAMFETQNVFSTVSAGTTSNLLVVYEPTASGTHSMMFSIVNNSASPNFVMNLRGLCYELAPESGPLAGGTIVTITNGHYGTATNVTVGGASATLLASGNNWVSFETPASGSTGAKTVVIQTSNNGDFTLASVFTYNPAGYINRITYDYDNWESAGSPLSQYAEFPSMAVYSNALYLMGGNGLTNVYRYASGAWTEVASLPHPIWGATAGSVGGYLYLAGGVNPGATITITNQMYRFDGTSWTRVAD
ncbi:MAG: IPT/TIG domain-containing protein, partial [Kiritimatiellae bacterium]|nr:IPT/TIG domain-containing protein [Kiritimatiellia bacterium]